MDVMHCHDHCRLPKCRDATRYGKARHDLPHIDIFFRVPDTRRERYRARSQLRPPAERGPCLHRTSRRGRRRVEYASARRAFHYLSLRCSAGECGSRRLATPLSRDGAVVGVERAVPPRTDCATRSLTSLAGERYTFFHFALLYQPPPRHRGSFVRRDFFRGTQGRLSSAGNERLITRSEAIMTRPRTQLPRLNSLVSCLKNAIARWKFGIDQSGRSGGA